MPKALAAYLGMIFYFWADEFSGSWLEPIHIHVCRGKQQKEKATKIWVRGNGEVEVANNDSRLTAKELSAALEYVRLNRSDIIAKWYAYFDEHANKQRESKGK
jgi:hypothetical protein